MDRRPNRAAATREQSEKESGSPKRGQAVSAGCGAFVMDGAAAGTGGHLPDRLGVGVMPSSVRVMGQARSRDEMESTTRRATCPRTGDRA